MIDDSIWNLEFREKKETAHEAEKIQSAQVTAKRRRSDDVEQKVKKKRKKKGKRKTMEKK